MAIINLNKTFIFILFIIPVSVFAQRGSDPDLLKKEIQKSTFEGSTQTKGLFTIYLGKKAIGSYEAWIAENGNTIEYHSKSDTKVKVIGTISIQYSLDCIYQDGNLIDSQVKSYRNNKLKGDTKMTWKGNNYAVVKDGESFTIDVPVRKGSILLYFGAPVTNGEKYFSESEAIIKEIKKVSNENFLLAESDSNKATEYIYKNGKLQQVNVPFSFGDFSIIRN